MDKSISNFFKEKNENIKYNNYKINIERNNKSLIDRSIIITESKSLLFKNKLNKLLFEYGKEFDYKKFDIYYSNYLSNLLSNLEKILDIRNKKLEKNIIDKNLVNDNIYDLMKSISNEINDKLDLLINNDILITLFDSLLKITILKDEKDKTIIQEKLIEYVNILKREINFELDSKDKLLINIFKETDDKISKLNCNTKSDML